MATPVNGDPQKDIDAEELIKLLKKFQNKKFCDNLSYKIITKALKAFNESTANLENSKITREQQQRGGLKGAMNRYYK